LKFSVVIQSVANINPLYGLINILQFYKNVIKSSRNVIFCALALIGTGDDAFTRVDAS